MEAFRNSDIPAHRRNVELIASGVINHIKVNNPDGIGEHVVDDVVPYAALFGKHYEPRENSYRASLDKVKGKYLEEPVLHYTPGTRVTKNVLSDLKEFEVGDVTVNDNEPDFEPHFVRSVMNLTADPDWMTQLGGFYTGNAFIKSVQRGATSPGTTTSFYSGLAKGRDFGKELGEKGKY